MNKRNKSKAAQPPPLPRSNFTSLPAEITAQIALLLDLTGAQSLARVAKCFTAPSECRIWEHVNITLDPKPRYIPTRSSSSLARATDMEDRRCSAIRGKARAVLMGLTQRRRVGSVNKLTVMPKAGVSHMLLDVLAVLAPTLKRLTIVGELEDLSYGPANVRPSDLDMLDLRLLHRPLPLPALTHVTLGKSAVRFAGFIPLLCDLARNLTTLEVTIGSQVSQAYDGFPSFPPATKLQRLHLQWAAYDVDHKEAKIILPVIRCSPDLRQLVIEYEAEQDEDRTYLYKIIGEHRGLQDMHWVGDMRNLPSSSNGEDGGFPCLRRLAVICDTWRELFTKLPAFPVLETLHIRHVDYHGPAEVSLLQIPTPSSFIHPAFVDPPSAVPFPSDFAKRLKSCPELRIIHVGDSPKGQHHLGLFNILDTLEKTETMTGYVRSIRHGSSELLHARMLLLPYWDPDRRTVNGVSIPSGLRGRIWHDGFDRRISEQTFPKGIEASWRDFTDFEGLTVPLSVFARMREVEGTEKEWVGRGIEVRDAAWQVLLDWKASQEEASW